VHAGWPLYQRNAAAAGIGARNHVFGLGTSDFALKTLTLPDVSKATIVNSVANSKHLCGDMIGILP
jgi:hypothetical protein